MEEVEHKAEFDEKGNVILKKKSKIKSGKSARAAGGRFELKVRGDLISKGWVVDKWSNNIDLENEKVVPAKRKFNPFRKMLVIGTGFPDFVCTKFIHEGSYDVIGVEVKMNGLLSKEEKEKCRWLLDTNIFSQIMVAKKSEKRGVIDYVDFRERYIKS